MFNFAENKLRRQSVKKVLLGVCTLLTVASAFFATPASALELVRVNGSSCWAPDSLKTICTLRVSNGFFTSPNTKAIQLRVKSSCWKSGFSAWTELRAWNSDQTAGYWLLWTSTQWSLATRENFGGLIGIPTIPNTATNRSLNSLEVTFGARKSCLDYIEAYRVT